MSSFNLRDAARTVIDHSQPIEQQIIFSERFRRAIDVAFNDAEHLWAPDKRGKYIWEGMATINGQVTVDRPFDIVIDEKQYLILQGFRTRYTERVRNQFSQKFDEINSPSQDVCKMQIVGDGITLPPFILDGSTRYVIFSNTLITRPEKPLQLTMLEGEGKLQFVCIGATIYRGYQYGGLAYNITDVGEQGTILHVDVPEEGSDARMRAFVNSWRANNGES